MAFLEAEFTRAISFKRLGGPGFSTFVVGIESGGEQRNQNWSQARAKYTASVITPTRDSLGQPNVLAKYADDLRNFFYAARGKAIAFRFFDPLDYAAFGEPVAALGGNLYQLQKTYTFAGTTYVRKITKPITSSVLDFQGNPLTDTVVLKNVSDATVAGTVDHTTGIVTSAASPTRASFRYHIPVRFDTDSFDVQVEDSGVGDGNPIVSWNSLALMEVRPPNY